MSATSDVTDGLRRTMQLMQQELDRSLLTNQMLESSTDTMRRTTTQQTAFSDVLGASKALITALERADLLDRLLILAALAFFALVCAFIIKRRVLDRGIRLASVLVPKRKRAVAASAVSAATAIVASVSPLTSVLASVAIASSMVQVSSAAESVVISTPTATTIEPTPTSETLASISAYTTVPVVESATTAPVAAPPEDADDDLPEPTDAAVEDDDDEEDEDDEEWEDADEDEENGEDELLDVDLAADATPDATEPDVPEPAPASPPVLTAEPVLETAAPEPAAAPVHNEL